MRRKFAIRGRLRGPRPRYVAPAPPLTQEQRNKILTEHHGGGRSRKRPASMRQGTLPLEIVNKGRFEKSEPTIHHGEDLRRTDLHPARCGAQLIQWHGVR